MGIIKRQSLKTSLVNYVGVLIGVIFFNFVFPHLISEEYLGLIGLLQNLSYILYSLPALGLAHILLRYYVLWKDSDELNHYHAFAIFTTGIALLVFSILYILLREPIIANYQTHSSLFLPYFYLVIPLVVIQTFTQYLELYSWVRLRVAVPAFLREIVTRLLLIALVYLFVYHMLSEQQFIYGLVAAYGLTFLILLIYTVKGLNFSLGSAREFLRRKTDRKPLFLYGGGMLLLTLSSNIHNFLDGIILPAYLGLGALGIYLRPLVLGQMIQVPYRAISQISIPIIREAIVDNNLRKVYELNRQIGLNLFLIGSFLFTLLVANADAIFSLLPPAYSSAKSVLYIIAAGRLVDMAFGLNSEILNYSKYYRFIIILSLLMMGMTIGLNVLLIPQLGMNGAALAVSVSLMVFNVLKSWIIFQKFGFHCFSKHYLTLLLITLAVIGVLYAVPYLQIVQHHMFFNACLNIALKGALGALLYLLPVYFFRVSPDLNHFVQLILSGKIFKGGHKMDNL